MSFLLQLFTCKCPLLKAYTVPMTWSWYFIVRFLITPSLCHTCCVRLCAYPRKKTLRKLACDKRCVFTKSANEARVNSLHMAALHQSDLLQETCLEVYRVQRAHLLSELL